MNRIYSEYRGVRYTLIRSRWEPWYSSSWNRALSDDPAIVQERQESIREFLDRCLPVAQIVKVVDVGGDRGQFIPMGRQRYVVEVSGRRLQRGVSAIPDVSAIPSPDLIMSCHVLEHLSDPKSEIEKYRSAKWIYAEVPAGVPTISRRRSVATWASLAMSVSPVLWRMTASPSTGRVPSAVTPYRISEHVNFFSEDGLASLFERSGFRVADVATSKVLAPDASRVQVLQLLAQTLP